MAHEAEDSEIAENQFRLRARNITAWSLLEFSRRHAGIAPEEPVQMTGASFSVLICDKFSVFFKSCLDF